MLRNVIITRGSIIHSRQPFCQVGVASKRLETKPSPSSTRACSVSYNYAWEYFGTCNLHTTSVNHNRWNGTGCNNLFQETCINVGGETRCTLRYNPELGSMPAEFCTFESLNHVYTGSKIIPPSASHRVPDRPSAGRGTPHGLVYYFPYSYIARFPAFLALYRGVASIYGKGGLRTRETYAASAL